MDISTILGMLLGFGLIVYGIGFGSLGNFYDEASVYITIGGTIASVIACYPLNQLSKVGSHMKFVVKGNMFRPETAINKLVELAQLARKNGLLALEEQAAEIKDPFFKRGVLLVVDAMDAEKVRSVLEEEMEAMDMRHDAGASIYEKAAMYGPAFGMIGTLVGLVNMLLSMDLDSGASSSLGKSMGTALITTFYGSVIANVIFLPIAKKLRIRNDEEMLYRQIIVEGVIGIQCGDNPKNLKEKLVSYLSQKQQKKLLAQDDDGGAAGSKKKKKE